MKRHVSIVSTGVYVPEIEITNDALRARFASFAPTFVDKMQASCGIETRWSAPDDWATSDLAVRAGRVALERAGLMPNDIDLIVVGTDSPDYITPSTSVVVQHKLGASRAGTFDVGCACASFPTAVGAAAGLMQMNPSLEKVLVIGAYMMRKLADPNDPMVFFYGDGAGAAVLGLSDEPGVLGATFRADGAYAKHWGIYAGGTAEPASAAAIEAGRTQVRVVEKFPPEVNDEGWPKVVHQLAQQNGFAIRDIDLAIFTQVRKSTIIKVMASLELPLARTHTVMEKWGYTGSACVPMALHDALQAGKAKSGDLVVLVGSGVGYNQAGLALRLTDAYQRLCKNDRARTQPWRQPGRSLPCHVACISLRRAGRAGESSPPRVRHRVDSYAPRRSPHFEVPCESPDRRRQQSDAEHRSAYASTGRVREP
jgi:3-oxoacyl-[acyl-carrier-protein] synthase-3